MENLIYLAYGSNNFDQISERTNIPVEEIRIQRFAGIMTLSYYKILFSKRMTNGNGAANIHLGGIKDKVILFAYALPASVFEIGSTFMRSEGCNFEGYDSRNHYNLLPFVLSANMAYKNPEFKFNNLFIDNTPTNAVFFEAEQSKLDFSLKPSPEYLEKVNANLEFAKNLGVY